MFVDKFSYEDILDNLINEEDKLMKEISTNKENDLLSFSQKRLERVRRQILDCRRFIDKKLK